MQPLGHRTAAPVPGNAALGGPRPASGVSLPHLQAAMDRARSYLLSLQRSDGHWCAELEGDTILESEYLLLFFFLGMEDDPRVAKGATYIRSQQLLDGGWAIYPGGPAEVSASVKAYFLLKLVGDDPSAPHMVAARKKILTLGGAEAVNTYTKTYLAIFGQYDWEKCPAIPPEIMLLPNWFVFNIYEMSSWSRAIFVPLSIIWAHKPFRPVPDKHGIEELFSPVGAPGQEPALSPREIAWRKLFFTVDRVLRTLERASIRPLRQRALKRAERWVLERLQMSRGLGAIFPSIVNTVMALSCQGYALDHPKVQEQLHELELLEIDLGDSLKLEPCQSPVWDTAQCVSALVESGMEPASPPLRDAARWLLDKEVRHKGDWAVRVPGCEPGGWYFEYANEFYPDCDDTAEVMLALAPFRREEDSLDQEAMAARRRALAWLLAMQNEDGGWAAFDKGCENEILTLVPFADHNAMIDPSCEDITGRVLEALAAEGFTLSHPAVQRGIRFLERTQHEDGTWYGRWGSNYIYGTWLALRGLATIGEDMGQERYQRAARWLRAMQNEDGGWGESLASYDDPSLKGRGASTAAQTSWALMALFATGDYESTAVERGLAYLLEHQLIDGSWEDESWTGTGFPKVFYLRYHMYDKYFPLLALAHRAKLETPPQARHA